MSGCLRLRSFPEISSNIKFLNIGNTKIQDIPASIAGSCLRLDTLLLGSRSFKRLTHVPECVSCLELSNSDIKRIPDCVISLPKLRELYIRNCRKLVSLQGLPRSLWILDATDCGSLKNISFSLREKRASITINGCVKLEKEAIRVSSSYYRTNKEVTLRNCFLLDEEARRVIIQRWVYHTLYLPGKEVPAEFTYKATGKSITIPSGTFSASSRFKACLLLSPALQIQFGSYIDCCLRSNGVLINQLTYYELSKPPHTRLLREHLLVFSGGLFEERRCLKVTSTSEIQFEFFCKGNDDKIIKCGVQILTEEWESNSWKWKEQSDGAIEVSQNESVVKSSKHTGWWSWLRKLWSREE